MLIKISIFVSGLLPFLILWFSPDIAVHNLNLFRALGPARFLGRAGISEGVSTGQGRAHCTKQDQRRT